MIRKAQRLYQLAVRHNPTGDEQAILEAYFPQHLSTDREST